MTVEAGLRGVSMFCPAINLPVSGSTMTKLTEPVGRCCAAMVCATGGGGPFRARAEDAPMANNKAERANHFNIELR